MADDAAGLSGPQMIKQIVGEIAAMEYAGKVNAIAALVIDDDGDLRVMTAFTEGTKMSLLGASIILQRQMMEQVVVIKKDRDI